MKNGVLLLDDGSYYLGRIRGVEGEVSGEIVFNTGMTGYQEMLTDPSYTGQMIVLTYPLIGNYGINSDDNQADRVTTLALIVKELQKNSNWRAEEELEEFLIRNNVLCLESIDTRSLVLRLRDKGTMKAVLSSTDTSIDSLQKKIAAQPGIVGLDLVKRVTTRHIYQYDVEAARHYIDFPRISYENRVNCVAVYDFGVKTSILHYLKNIARKVIVFPADTPVDVVMKYNPSGIFLSNGPGDPSAVNYAISNVRQIISEYPGMPVFGICLGHQIIALALKGVSYKLKFGHHGVNQPVKNLLSGKVEITSQNHCFAIDEKSLQEDITITHINLNDNTLEGMQLKGKPVFSVQYHPEASPGPNDSNYLFEKFYKVITGQKRI